MWKVETEKFKVKQRGGELPDIEVTKETYIPQPKGDLPEGVTRSEFHKLLRKASKPIEPESGKS